MKRLILAAAAIGVMAIPMFAQTGTSNVSVTVGAEASITVTDATTTLANSSTLFADYTGTTHFTYRIRTSVGTGSGSIVVEAGAITRSGLPTRWGGPLPAR